MEARGTILALSPVRFSDASSLAGLTAKALWFESPGLVREDQGRLGCVPTGGHVSMAHALRVLAWATLSLLFASCCGQHVSECSASPQQPRPLSHFPAVA